MRIAMLTTVDNPYDPFTQYEDWYQFDTSKGYNSCSYLARVSFTSLDLSDKDNSMEIERAIDEICQIDPFQLYRKVVKDTESKE